MIYITILRGGAKTFESREILTPKGREIFPAPETADATSAAGLVGLPDVEGLVPADHGSSGAGDPLSKIRTSSAAGRPITDSLVCPYCLRKDFVRRGWRNKERERVQLYLCKSCEKSFTPRVTLGKHYPLPVILESMSVYNLGYSLEETCRIVSRTPGVVSAVVEAGLKADIESSISEVSCSPEGRTKSAAGLHPSTLSSWIQEFEHLCRFGPMMREHAIKLYSPKEMVETATLAHRQLFRYRFHRAKCQLVIEGDFKHRRFGPLKEFLELVPGECPHQYFEDGKSAGMRASEAPLTFSKTAMIVRAKNNFANALATFVLQSVDKRKDRHEALQKFMLYNDSVTVATEVPVYIMRDDLLHLKSQLGFEIYHREPPTTHRLGEEPKATTPESDTDSGHASLARKSNNETPLQKLPDVESEVPVESCSEVVNLPKLITGHIDLLQIRNGMIHILDYKPNAQKERPIEQLTLYAMALSRLTGLRLFEFKCAWFDEKDYFEFYPLHVLHKTKKAVRRRKIETNEGVYLVNKNEKKVESIRPIRDRPVAETARSSGEQVTCETKLPISALRRTSETTVATSGVGQ